MGEFQTETLVTILALVGVVIMIAALLSGVIERSGFPQVAVFLVLGAVLGPAGLGMINLTLDSPILHIVATLSLALVLFTDAISLNLAEVRRSGTLALLVLGPGTLLSAALIAIAGWGLLGLPPAAAALLGAALASTDPVLLRGLLRRNDIPGRARQALRLESGLNDVVLLPIVVVAMKFLEQAAAPTTGEWARLVLDLFVLGPGAGVLVGICGVATLDVIRRRVGVRRDYEALFSLGIAFTAYAAAEAVHGSGFLAAFAAGLVISMLDVELCDCFLEYGETTAELTLLFTFVLFGASLIWSGFAAISPLLILFAVISLLIRPIAFLVSLARIRLSIRARAIIAWFGPRGLSSLLLVLLPVFARLEGSTQLFAVCSFVVLLSIVVHGGSPFILNRRWSPKSEKSEPNGPEETSRTVPEPETLPSPIVPVRHRVPESPEATTSTPIAETAEETPVPEATWNRRQTRPIRQAEPVQEITQSQQPEPVEPVNMLQVSSSSRISLKELQRLRQEGAPVALLDVRTERTYERSNMQARGALRLIPHEVGKRAKLLDLPHDAWLVAYCA
jgi:NhaP-type Na+/H+ or K+/H+ antiporter